MQDLRNQIHVDGNTIFLHDFIGETITPTGKLKGIDANDFIAKFIDLDNKGFDVINIRINSGGGSVIDGFSIFSTLNQAKTFTHVFIDGIAASIAAIIALAGDKITIAENGLMMVHDPFLASGKDDLSDKETKQLNKIKASIAKAIESKSGMAEDVVDRLMTEETWFNADEAIEHGLVDESQSLNEASAPLVLNKSDDVYSTISEIHNAFSGKIIKPKSKDIQMKDLCNVLKLNENADEKSILDAVNTILENEKASLERYTELENKIDELVEKLEASEEKNTALETDRATALIENAISDGKITEDGKETWLTMASSDFENTKNAIDAITVTVAPENLNEVINKTENTEDVKDWNWYSKNAPVELKNIKNNDPEKYQALLDMTFSR